MFDYDKWQEIFYTIRKNKLRTFLTLMGISSGMFILIILLGMTNSFRDGIISDFNFATNSGFLWGRRMTISYEGFQPGRRIRFNNSDTELLRERVKELENLAPRNSLQNAVVIRNNESSTFEVYGDYPDFNKIEIKNIEKGRFINQKDIEEKRKVAIIGSKVQKVLFASDEDPIGKYINIRKINFLVVGIIKPIRDGGDEDSESIIHIPFTTFQKSFNYGDRVGWYGYSLKAGAKMDEVEPIIIKMLKEKNKIHPLDEDAVGHFNLQAEFDEINGLFTGLESFTWFVGIALLFAGLLGVSNIMLIIVKERTKEIGIRKALGATPKSIISLVLQESVALALIGGYFAMIFGLSLLEVIGIILPKDGDLPFLPPEVNPWIILMALLILVTGGAVAGLLPAMKASSISPMEAIRVD